MNNGRPLTWSNDELIEKLLSVRSKYPNIKLTKSLLEKETGIGRNTWQRRMNKEIDKINVLNYSTNYSNINNNTKLPDIETIFRITNNNPNELANELLKFESIIIDQHREIERLKELEKELLEVKDNYDILLKKNEKYKVQASFYKSAYSSLMVSSTYSYLQDVNLSIVKEHGIKESLIAMNKDIKNLSLIQLHSFFDSIESEEQANQKKRENMKILSEKFDI